MRLTTSRFGEIEVDDSQIVTFTQPIIGFPEHRRFTVLPGPQDGLTFWLQSTEDGELAFILMNPRSTLPGYEIKLGRHEMDELAVKDLSELDIYTLVVVSADPKDVRTNLKAPILINPKSRLAKQTILEKSTYPIRHYLQRREEDTQTAEETIDARSNA